MEPDKKAIALILVFGFILLLPALAKKKESGSHEVTPEVKEKGARYGFLQLSEAEYGEAVKATRYPEPKRYEELTAYYTKPREVGWKGLSLAEMFPGKYKDLLKRGVPNRLSPSEVKAVIGEKRIPYYRGVEPTLMQITGNPAPQYLYRSQNIGTIDDLVKLGKLIGHTPQEAHDAILKAHPEYAEEWGRLGIKREEETWGVDEQETQEPRLYFTKEEKTGYTGQLLLRVKRDIADAYGGELVEDIGLPGEFFYDGRAGIPISQIEVMVGAKWIPLEEELSAIKGKEEGGSHA